MRRGVIALAAVVSALACAAATAAPPPVSAPAYVVRGGPDDVVLASRAPDAERAPASITKLMTVIVALDHARLADVVTVPPQAAAVGESSVDLRPGERLTVRDLAIAALVPSANDAATALALYVGHGSIPRFVALMNAKARALGLTRTHFVNPHGLDTPGHFSSARDVTTLLDGGAPQPVHPDVVDALDGDDRRAGGSSSRPTTCSGSCRSSARKTGHTNAAGWSQVAAIRKGSVRITASVLGAQTEEQRNGDLAGLLAWGLAQYHGVTAVSSKRVYGLAETGYGRAPVKLVAVRDVVRPVRVGSPLVERVVVGTALPLPVTRGQRVGEVRVYSGRRLVARAPLVAATSVSSVSTAGKVGWYARRTVHHLVGIVG